MNIQSSIYRGHEIVCMPNGTRLIHKGDRSGPLVGQEPSEDAADGDGRPARARGAQGGSRRMSDCAPRRFQTVRGGGRRAVSPVYYSAFEASAALAVLRADPAIRRIARDGTAVYARVPAGGQTGFATGDDPA